MISLGLTQLFLRKLGMEYGRQIKGIDSEVMRNAAGLPVGRAMFANYKTSWKVWLSSWTTIM